MSTPTLQQFQQQVSDLLLRDRSMLDVLSKFGQTEAAVNRAVTKAVTECGCIEIQASRQPYSDDPELETAKRLLGTHMDGAVCENCRDVLKTELGRHLFYMSALCNHLDIDLGDVLGKESDKCSTLGIFNLT